VDLLAGDFAAMRDFWAVVLVSMKETGSSGRIGNLLRHR
jgi:hypothetical protein